MALRISLLIINFLRGWGISSSFLMDCFGAIWLKGQVSLSYALLAMTGRPRHCEERLIKCTSP
jgi:hypothetical protein